MSARWKWALRVAAALTIAPLFAARHLPFCDLPEHLAVIATLRHWWDPAWRAQELFFVAGIDKTQYLLYDLVAALLAWPIGSAERANLVLLALAGIGFPYSLRELLRALARDERLAVIGCALFWNRALAEGLVNYVAAIPVAVWGLALVVRQAEAPTRGRGAGIAALAVALFYLHISAFLVFVLGALVATALLPRPARVVDFGRQLARLPLRAWWLAPAGVAAIAFALTSTVTHPDPSQGPHAGRVRFAPSAFLAKELFGWMHDVFRSGVDDFAAVVLWIAMIAIVARRSAPEADARARWMRGVGACVFAIALGSYFLMPSQVGFAFLLDVRLAPVVGLFAALLAPARDDLLARRAAVAVTAASMLVGAHALWQVRAFEVEEAAHFDQVLRRLPAGKKLLTLTFDQRSERMEVTPFVHFGAYYRVRYGGVASFSFAELPHWPLQYRPEAAPPKKRIVFWDWNPCLFRNAHDGPYYDFVLARGEIDPFAGNPPGPKWRLIGGARDWKLWERAEGWNEGDPATDDGPCRPPAPTAVGDAR